jgi:hypothetical protein
MIGIIIVAIYSLIILIAGISIGYYWDNTNQMFPHPKSYKNENISK